MIMKTLTIFLLGVILVISGCSKSDEFPEGNMTDNELKSADSRTINFDMKDMFPGGYYDVQLICDGKIVDYLVEDAPGEEISAHATAHIIDGKFVWAIVHFKGTLISEATGETFKLVQQTKVTFGENFEQTSNIHHVHALGNQGTHVMNFFELDFDAQTFVLTKSVCSPSSE